MKKILCYMLILCMLLCVFVSCGGNAESESQSAAESESDSETENGLELNIIDDGVRNWYSIYVYSFCDSDGDGVGDLEGVTQKLGYISGLGFNGIRLMPILKSDNLSGEATLSFYEMDGQLGEIDDLKTLTDRAHELGIEVIMDLELNHTSKNHPVFVQNCEYIKENGVPLGNTYCFTSAPENPNSPFVKKLDGTNYYYECRNLEGLPDIDLDSAYWRQEIRNALGFWLDTGIDGFYLCDAGEYFTDKERTVEFLSWLTNVTKETKADCYTVAQISTYDPEIAASYAESGVDSIVYLGTSDAAGVFSEAIRTVSGSVLGEYADRLDDLFNGSIPSSLIADNNSANRPASFLSSSDRAKLIFGISAVMSGNIFSFYGDEIGMVSKNGPDSEAAKLLPIKWDKNNGDGYCTQLPEGAQDSLSYIYASVSEQENDPNSILTYYKQALYIRNCMPILARGDAEYVSNVTDKGVCVLKRTYGDEQVYVVINLNFDDSSVKLDKSALGFEKIEAVLCTLASQSVAYDKSAGTLDMPPLSIVILR